MIVKVCGMRDAENIRAVASLPIDLMGFIFYEKSPRYVSNTGILPVPAHVERVGVFVNADIDFVVEKIKTYQLNYLQLHGDETPEYCRDIQAGIEALTLNEKPSRTLPIAIGIKGVHAPHISDLKEIKVIKAFRVNEDFDFPQTKKYEKYCAYFLFDTKKKRTNAVLPPPPSKGGDFSLCEKLHASVSPSSKEAHPSPSSEEASSPLSPLLEGTSSLSSPPLEGAQGVEYGGTGEKFNWQILQQYTGKTPFLLSGGIGAEDAEAVRRFAHPKFAGIDVNSKFELEPALKDVQKIKDFLEELLS